MNNNKDAIMAILFGYTLIIVGFIRIFYLQTHDVLLYFGIGILLVQQNKQYL